MGKVDFIVPIFSLSFLFLRIEKRFQKYFEKSRSEAEANRFRTKPKYMIETALVRVLDGAVFFKRRFVYDEGGNGFT